MLKQIIKSELLEDLSAEQQQLLSGGQRNSNDEPSIEFPTGSRVRRVPIRLTGILEVVKPEKEEEEEEN